MSVLRYYARDMSITFIQDQSWYSAILGGKNELEKKEAELLAWERKSNFKEVQELLVRLAKYFVFSNIIWCILLENRSHVQNTRITKSAKGRCSQHTCNFY